MFKTVTLLKRRPDMSFEEFRSYYEANHAPLGITLMPQARRYIRRYVTPLPYPTTGEVAKPDFDVITEVWCDSRSDYEKMLAHLAEPEIAALIVEDEERFLDRSKTKLLFVEECETPAVGND